MTADSNNLLVQLHTWAHRQDENFTTDAFAHLLGRLVSDAPLVGASVLSCLTGMDLSEEEWAGSTIDTQVVTPHGRPDMRIVTATALIFVEVKVEAILERSQPEAYLRALQEVDDSLVTRLVVLTRYPAPDSLPPSVHSVRWHEIEEELERSIDSMEPGVCRYLVEQYREFLAHRGMASLPVRSGVSGGIRSYQEEHGVDGPLFRGKLRSIDRLREVASLTPLADLLAAMHRAIEQSSWPHQSLTMSAGADRGGWIGWNIDRLKYFFYLWFDAPEVVMYQTCYPPIDPSLHDGQLGQVYEDHIGGRWEHSLDLGSVDGFFELSRERQQVIMVEFINECLEAIHRVEPGDRAD